MIKTMFALLLIAGIIAAAHLSEAYGGDAMRRSDPREAQRSAPMQLPSARSFDQVPWLDHGVLWKDRSELPIGPRLDTLEPLRLQPVPQLTASTLLPSQSTTR